MISVDEDRHFRKIFQHARSEEIQKVTTFQSIFVSVRDIEQQYCRRRPAIRVAASFIVLLALAIVIFPTAGVYYSCQTSRLVATCNMITEWTAPTDMLLNVPFIQPSDKVPVIGLDLQLWPDVTFGDLPVLFGQKGTE